MSEDLAGWMTRHARPGVRWYVKRLSANDTLATNAHQAGPYIAKETAFLIHPGLKRPRHPNPEVWIDLSIGSHGTQRRVRLVWYNNRLSGDGTRNETRLTNFGGAESPFLDPESTGSIAILAFEPGGGARGPVCHAWVCRNAADEELVEERLGQIDPGKPVLWDPETGQILGDPDPGEAPCALDRRAMPASWLQQFPTGEEIIRKAVELRPLAGEPADARLVRRRICEYEIFRSIEETHYLPRIRKKFGSIDSFVSLAQAILQSRKSRAGNSLELHAREVFREEGLVDGRDFSHRPVIEGGKRPDFVFPSAAAYADASFPPSALTILAAKTTCKDRWRQILNEADRVQTKHLLTLQEGVSEAQFREMTGAGVKLVVPAQIQKAYPASIRGELIPLSGFIRHVKEKARPAN